MTASGASLTGGSSPASSVAQNQSWNTIKHDMAVKFNKPTGAFADDQGVFALEWEMDVVEDATLGQQPDLDLHKPAHRIIGTQTQFWG